MELGRFLRLAINLAAGLGKLHRRWLIHKDIKPANILVKTLQTHEVWFTGFGIASRLPRERQAAEPPEVIAGTLAYMAPEPDRSHESVDRFPERPYSLGITFYEMLTGVLPSMPPIPLSGFTAMLRGSHQSLASKQSGSRKPISAIVLETPR